MGKFVLVTVHAKRGKDGMTAAGVLPFFAGIALNVGRSGKLQDKRHALAAKLQARLVPLPARSSLSMMESHAYTFHHGK